MASAVVGALRVVLSLDSAEFDTAMKRVSSSAKEWGNDLTSMGRQATAVGSALTKTLTLPLLAVGLGAAKAAMDFESSFANVSKTVDGVSDSSGVLTTQGKALAQVFRDMAKEMPATTTELNAIAAIGGQMGVPIEQLAHFTKNVAALGVAVDGISAEEAAKGLAQIGNATGQGTTKIAEFASTLVHLGNNSNATEGDILEFTKRLIGAGHSAGMTVPEVMAIGTAMADVGINAEAGGTAMSTVIAKIGKSVSTGGEDLKRFAAVAGKSAEEFAAVWRNSSAQGIDLFVRGLSTMRERGVDLNLTMGELGTEGVRVASTLKLLAGAGDGVSKALVLANDGYAAGNKHLEEAEKKYNTLANQMKKLWNNVNDVAITFGTALMPTMRDLVGVLTPLVGMLGKLAEWFSKLPEPIRMVALGMAAIVAATGPAIWVFGQIALSAGTIVKAFTSKGIAMKALTALYGPLSTALVAIGTSFVAIGALAVAGGVALVEVGKAIVNLYKHWQAGKPMWDFFAARDEDNFVRRGLKWVGILNDTKAAVTSTGAAAQDLSESFDGVGQYAEALGPPVERANKKFHQSEEELKAAKDAADAFAKSLKSLGGADAMAGAQEVVKQLGAMGGPLNVLPSKLDEMAAKLREGAQAAMLMGKTGYAEQLMKLADTLRPIVQFQQKWNVTVGEYVTQAHTAADATEALWEQFHRLTGQVQTIAPLLKNGMDLSKLFVGFKESVTQHLPKSDQWAQAWGEMKTGLSQTLASIPGTLMRAFEGGGDVWGAVKSIGSQIGSGIGSAIGMAFGGPVGQKIGAALGSLVGPAMEGFKKLFGVGINDAVKKANGEIEKLRQGLLATHGNMETLEARANAVGLSFQAAWGHQGQAGLVAFQGLMREFEQRVADSEAAVAELNGKLNTTQGELDGLIGKARDLGYEFDQNGNFIGVSFDTVKAKAEEFGVSVDGLGARFRQQGIDAEAGKIINAFTLLEKAGGDVGGILVGMKDEIGKVVGQSIKFGTTIPKNMEPWIIELMRTDQLIDENGEKITDLSKIKFGEPVATQFETIALALKEVVQKLQDILNSIAAIPANKTMTVRAEYIDPGPPANFGDTGQGGDRNSGPGTAAGTMGRFGTWFKDWGIESANTMHGIEAVVTPQQAPAFAMEVLGSMGGGASSGGGDMSALLSEISGLRRDMMTTIPAIAESAARHGWQTSGRRR